MRHVFPIWLLFLVLSLGCGNKEVDNAMPTTATPENSSVIPTFTPRSASKVDSAETVDILPLEYIEKLATFPYLIAPDGQKFLIDTQAFDSIEQPPSLVSIFSINTKEITTFEIPRDRTSTIYYPNSWAPDSTAFAGVFFDSTKWNGADWCCGAGVAITDISSGKVETSIYSWDWNHGTKALWSDDSSMLCIPFLTGMYSALVLSRDGELLKTLEEGQYPQFWLGTKLYFTTRQDNRIELRNWDPETEKSNLIVDDLDGKYFVAKNAGLNQTLWAMSVGNNEGQQNSTAFYVLDLNLKTFRQVVAANPEINKAYSGVSSPSQEYVAFEISKESQENSLWVFDWKSHELNNYGQISDLLGWYENMDGFLVTSIEGEQKIVKP
jgi:hypothetical protein